MKKLDSSVTCRTLALFVSLACVPHANATLIFAEDFEGGTVDANLSTLPGWTFGAEGGAQVIGSDGSSKFATTSSINNTASRYDRAVVNPGFGPGVKVIMTMDVYDPLVNSQSSLSTFPRAYGGLMQSGGAAGMPAYFGIEHDDATANDGIAEWVAAGENFAPRHFGPADTLAQDTWFTMRAEWNLGAETMDVYAKTRDGADPFVQIFAGVSTPFADANQDLSALNVWRQRLNRGTRIDNIRVEAIPEPAGWVLMLVVVLSVGTRCCSINRAGGILSSA